MHSSFLHLCSLTTKADVRGIIGSGSGGRSAALHWRDTSRKASAYTSNMRCDECKGMHLCVHSVGQAAQEKAVEYNEEISARSKQLRMASLCACG